MAQTLIVCALAVYRIARALVLETGPFGAWRALRKWAGVIETYNAGADGNRVWDVTISKRVTGLRRELAETLI